MPPYLAPHRGLAQVAIYQREWLRDWARLAERLANLGIAASFDPAAHLAAYPPACRPVVLAAAHAAGRWSPALARHYPPAFRAAVQELVRISSPLALRQRQGRRRSPTGVVSFSSSSSCSRSSSCSALPRARAC